VSSSAARSAWSPSPDGAIFSPDRSCAELAELANDDDQLLRIGRWAETVASRLFPVMSFVVLGFGIGLTQNLGIVLDMVAKPFS
jgi:hypothetical protein